MTETRKTLESETDSKQIGTSHQAKRLMESEVFKSHFSRQQHMIKFAVAVAIANKLSPNRNNLTDNTTHRTSDLDEDGSLRFLVQQYKSENQRPYFIAEGLAEAGFIFIEDQIRDGRNLENLIHPSWLDDGL